MGAVGMKKELSFFVITAFTTAALWLLCQRLDVFAMLLIPKFALDYLLEKHFQRVDRYTAKG